MRYSIVTEEQLHVLQQGLDLLGHVNRDLLPTSLYFYGLLGPNSPVLSSINEAAWEDNYAGEVRADNLKLQTAVVGIRLSDDILAALLGSGLHCTDQEFIYMLDGEPHTSSFSHTSLKPTVQLSQFGKFALAGDSYYMKDFLQAEGQAQEQQNPGVAERTEQAVGQHGGAEREIHNGPGHQSSLKIWGDLRVGSWGDRDTAALLERVRTSKIASTDRFVVWNDQNRMMVVQATDVKAGIQLIARSVGRPFAQVNKDADVLDSSEVVRHLKGYLLD